MEILAHPYLLMAEVHEFSDSIKSKVVGGITGQELVNEVCSNGVGECFL